MPKETDLSYSGKLQGSLNALSQVNRPAFSKKQVSMIRKYYTHTLQTNPRHLGEEPSNTNSHKAPGRQLNKTRSYFPIEMIAKLERHKVLNNKPRTKHRTSTNNVSNSKQRINNFRTISSLSHRGFKCILLVPNLCP